MALWCYLLPNWSINNLKVAPGLTGSELDIGNRILAAAKDIYQRGTTYNYMLDPRMTVTADKSTAYPVTIDGQEYKQQVFTVWSETWVYDYDVSVAFSDPPRCRRARNRGYGQQRDHRRHYRAHRRRLLRPVQNPLSPGERGGPDRERPALPLRARGPIRGHVRRLPGERPIWQFANYICDLDNNVQLDVAAISNYADNPEDDPPIPA